MCMRNAMCFEETTFIAGGVVTVLILILITVVFISMAVALIRSKRLIQKELKNIKESQMKVEYEEITPALPPLASGAVETTKNAAYTCISGVYANFS